MVSYHALVEGYEGDRVGLLDKGGVGCVRMQKEGGVRLGAGVSELLFELGKMGGEL